MKRWNLRNRSLRDPLDLMILCSVCWKLFNSVKTPEPRAHTLIYPSSITNVSAVIYEAAWGRKGWDLAGGGLGPLGQVMVGVCDCVYMDWSNMARRGVVVDRAQPAAFPRAIAPEHDPCQLC